MDAVQRRGAWWAAMRWLVGGWRRVGLGAQEGMEEELRLLSRLIDADTACGKGAAAAALPGRGPVAALPVPGPGRQERP